jgi:hypothetical protein
MYQTPTIAWEGKETVKRSLSAARPFSIDAEIRATNQSEADGGP